jgi:hypothetical protein
MRIISVSPEMEENVMYIQIADNLESVEIGIFLPYKPILKTCDDDSFYLIMSYENWDKFISDYLIKN